MDLEDVYQQTVHLKDSVLKAWNKKRYVAGVFS
jgi:hypothetical protein